MPDGGIEWDRLAQQLRDPQTAEAAAAGLTRYTWAVLLSSPHCRTLKQFPARLDLSDVVQSAVGSVLRVAGGYEDRGGDGIRLLMTRVILNKAIDKIDQNLRMKRDQRSESVAGTQGLEAARPLPRPRNTDRIRDREGNDLPRSPNTLSADLDGLAIPEAIRLIQTGFSSEERQRLDEEAGSLPEPLRLVFWLTLTGMTDQEIADASEKCFGQKMTRSRVIHRQRLIRKHFRLRYGMVPDPGLDQDLEPGS